MKQVRLLVNGTPYELDVEAWETLVDVLRNDLGLTGTKEGCGIGECGACTVIMDGKTVNSCLVLAAEADGKQIITIEGLAEGEELYPVQQAFVEQGGLQCGFCTPGMIIATKALLDENPDPTEEDIKWALSGNICRCGNYNLITKSVLAAAEKMRGENSD